MRVAERHLRPFNASVPASGLQLAAQDVHDRALAGAVLADQRVNLAAAELEIHSMEYLDAVEALSKPGRA